MNTDLLTEDLKKKRSSNESHWHRGTLSLPFEPGEHRRVAVQIVDDRGIESLKIMSLNA